MIDVKRKRIIEVLYLHALLERLLWHSHGQYASAEMQSCPTKSQDDFWLAALFVLVSACKQITGSLGFCLPAHGRGTFFPFLFAKFRLISRKERFFQLELPCKTFSFSSTRASLQLKLPFNSNSPSTRIPIPTHTCRSVALRLFHRLSAYCSSEWPSNLRKTERWRSAGRLSIS